MKGKENERAGLNQRWMDVEQTLIWSPQVSPTDTTTSVFPVYLSVYVSMRTGQTGCVSDPNLCVCVCVCVVCMMPYTFYTKWLRPTEYSTGIHTLNHTVKHRNSKGSRKWGRNTSQKQTGGAAWESAPWQTPAAMAPSWQSALEGKQTWFQNQCLSKSQQLVTLVKQL